MDGAAVMIPVWLAAIVAAALVAQLFLGIAWAIRSDRERALQGQTLNAIAGKLDRHDLGVMRADLDANVARTREVAEGHDRLRRALEELRRDMFVAAGEKSRPG